MRELLGDLQKCRNTHEVSVSSAPLLRAGFRIFRKKAFLAISALLILLAAAFFYYKFYANQSAEIDSIAVLPFADAGGNADSEYLADGLTESVINRLSSLPDLKVMSFNSVSRYKNKEFDAQKIGRELGVKAILISRLTRRADEVFINTELVNISDNSRLWGYQYNGKTSDILGMQESISREISARLNLKLSGARRETQNAEAYQLYLKGRFAWNKRTGESLRQAIEFFKQAIERDPTYALAYAGLADCYSLLSIYTNLSPKETMPMAKAAAQKALEMDENLAEAHASLGLVRKDFDWDFAGAENSFKRAIELNPNYATAYQWRADNLIVLKRFDEAIVSMRKAQELDPLSLVINSKIGWAFYQAGNYDEAINLLQKTAEIDPNFARTYFFLGRAFQQKKMSSEAVNSAQKSVELSGGTILFKASLANIYATLGQKSESEKILHEFEEKAKTEYVSPVLFAVVYAGLDEKEKSLGWLGCVDITI
jgi:TolB-like protein/Flp pilus assembly protein TadD